VHVPKYVIHEVQFVPGLAASEYTKRKDPTPFLQINKDHTALWWLDSLPGVCIIIVDVLRAPTAFNKDINKITFNMTDLPCLSMSCVIVANTE
jgi:hypothetical protein